MSAHGKHSLFRLSLTVSAACVVLGGSFGAEAYPRRQMLPSIEVHLEVLQSLHASTQPRYAAPAQAEPQIPFGRPSAPLAAQQPTQRKMTQPQAQSQTQPQVAQVQPAPRRLQGQADQYQPSGTSTVASQRHAQPMPAPVAPAPEPAPVSVRKPAPKPELDFAMYQPAPVNDEPVAERVEPAAPLPAVPEPRTKPAPQPKPQAEPVKRIEKQPEPVAMTEPEMEEPEVLVAIQPEPEPQPEPVNIAEMDAPPPPPEPEPQPEPEPEPMELAEKDTVKEVEEPKLPVTSPLPLEETQPEPGRVEAPPELQLSELPAPGATRDAVPFPENLPPLPEFPEEQPEEQPVEAELVEAEIEAEAEEELPPLPELAEAPPEPMEAMPEELKLAEPPAEEITQPELESLPELPPLPVSEQQKLPEPIEEEEPDVLELADISDAPEMAPDLPLSPASPTEGDASELTETELAPEAMPEDMAKVEKEEFSPAPSPELPAPRPTPAAQEETGLLAGLKSQVSSWLGREEPEVAAPPVAKEPEITAPPLPVMPEAELVERETENETAVMESVKDDAAGELALPETEETETLPALPPLPSETVQEVPVAETANRSLPPLDAIISQERREKVVKLEEAAPAPAPEPPASEEPEVDAALQAEIDVQEPEEMQLASLEPQNESEPEPQNADSPLMPESEMPDPADAELAESEEQLASLPTEDAQPETPADTGDVPEPVVEEDDKGKISLLLSFTREQEAIPADMHDELDKLVAYLEEKPQARVLVQSYAGSFSEDQKISRTVSLKRGLSIRSYLIEKGIDTERVNVQAKGNANPGGGHEERVEIHTE